MSNIRTIEEIQKDIRTLARVSTTFRKVKLENLAEEIGCAFSLRDDKYRDHDLTKNPNDLPEPWEYVLINTYRNEVFVAQMDSVLNTWVKRDDEFDYCEVGSSMIKAWRYIKPFGDDNNKL